MFVMVVGIIVLPAPVERMAEQPPKPGLASPKKISQELEDLEQRLQAAQLSAMAQAKTSQEIIAEQIAVWQERLREKGDSSGALHFAIGRAQFECGAFSLAIAFFHEAEARGLLSQDVSFWLGMAYGRHYWQQLQELQIMGDAKWRSTRSQHLQALYGPQVEHYLSQAKMKGEGDRVLLDSLLAFNSQKFDQCLELLGIISRIEPEYGTGQILTGDAYLTLAQRALREGQPGKAEGFYQQALNAYQEGLLVAKSGIGSYLGITRVYAGMMQVSMHDWEQARHVAGRVETFLAEAASAGFTNPEMMALKVVVALRKGESAVEAGLSPAPAFWHATSAAVSLVEQAPDLYLSHYVRGHCALAQASSRLNQDLSHQRELQTAITSFEKGVLVAPEQAIAYLELAKAHRYAAQIYWKKGQDAEPEFLAALNALKTGVTLAPSNSDFWDAKAQAYAEWGQFQTSIGQDGLPAFAKAIACGERALRLNPQSAILHGQLARYHLEKGLTAKNQGCPEAEVFLEAIACSEQALKLDAKLQLGLEVAGLSWLALAEMNQTNFPDYSFCAAQARNLLVQNLSRKPNEATGIVHLARAAMLDMAIAREGKDRQWATIAGRLLKEALRANPNSAFGYYVLAQWSLSQETARHCLMYLSKAIQLDRRYRRMALEDPIFEVLLEYPSFKTITAKKANVASFP